MFRVIGIDPAPTKPALIYHNKGFEQVPAVDLPAFIARCLEANPSTLIAWDAPLSFSPADFYDRPVDKVVRNWAKEHVVGGRFAEGAINARSFAGLPHWVVSCASLGFPFGTPPHGLRLAPVSPDLSQPAPLVIEVHPAVAIGAWWLDAASSTPLPRYKGKSKECACIAEKLRLPSGCEDNDDVLDAFVAYRLGELFLEGDACWVGDPATGGYVMPRCQATDDLISRLSKSRND
jgi:hypothetical protein